MAKKSTVYTIHENPTAKDPADRLLLVPEGFAFWAFLLHGVWLFAKQQWLLLAVFLAAWVMLGQLAALFGLSLLTVEALRLCLQLLLGSVAHDVQRMQLARKGYVLRGVVVADSELMAEQRAHAKLAVWSSAPCV